MSEPTQQPTEPQPGAAPPSGFRFGTGTLLLVFTVCILVAAACGGLVRMESVGAQDAKMLIFALPLGGMIVASLIRGIILWSQRNSG